MKTTKFKKIMALLLTGMMTLSMFSGVALAEEPTLADYVETDTYVLNYSSQAIEGYEDWDAKRFYFSPFRTDISVEYNPVSGQGGWWGQCSASVLNMIDTGKLDAEKYPNPTTPYASIPVYCVDATTDGVSGFDYERVNLEDSEYFSDEVAGRVRAIIMNSFPHISDMSVITDAVNAWIDENGLAYEKVEGLHYYEVISATQSVIWVLTNNGELGTWYNDYRVYAKEMMDYAKGQNSVSIYGVSEEPGYSYKTEHTADNIEAVARYLIDLAPMAPQATLISETAFENLTVKKVEEADGTYTLTVSVKVVVDEKATSDLTLTAVLTDAQGNDKVYDKLTGITKTTEHTFVIKGVSENAAIKLTVDGKQTAGDVYLFSPEGGRHKSQTMAGYDESAKPVHAEIGVGPDRVINFNKIGKVEKDGVTSQYALEGIEFEIYYAGTVDEYTAFATGMLGATKEEIQAAFTDKAVKEKNETPLKVVVTDAAGKATCLLGNDTSADGIYLIIERRNPAIKTPLDPFVVAVPMSYTDEKTGTYVGQSYVLNLVPKNEVWPGPEVEKNINEIGKDLDSVAAGIGATHTWIIRGDIPVDIANGKSYVLTDTMDYRLTYQGNVRVAIEKEGEESVPLTEGTHYDLTVGKSKVMVGEGENQVEEVIDILKIELTEAGMDEAAKYQGYEVRVYFDAIIDEDAAAATLIPNDVTLDYENSVGIEFFDEGDAEVFTCAIEVLKHDAKDESNLLAGAVFKVAKEAVTAEELAEAVTLVVDRSTSIKVVYVDFYNTDAIDETTLKVDFVETSAEESKKGEAMIYGLAAGEYYLVETKAPAGYNLLSYPIKVTVGTGVDAEQNVVLSEAEAIREVKVANSNTFVLPETGGIGTVIFTVSGGLMTLAGGAILTLKKREEE